MLWKLDALQSFIRDLHWPEEVFAEHLDHRLKLMAADMIEAAAKRSNILIPLKILKNRRKFPIRIPNDNDKHVFCQMWSYSTELHDKITILLEDFESFCGNPPPCYCRTLKAFVVTHKPCYWRTLKAFVVTHKPCYCRTLKAFVVTHKPCYCRTLKAFVVTHKPCYWRTLKAFVVTHKPCYCRTLKAFETFLKRGGKSTDYILPTEMLVMVNVIIDFKNQVCNSFSNSHKYSYF